MKISGQETKAFALSGWTAAVAQKSTGDCKNDTFCQPSVQILGTQGAVAIIGAKALTELKLAVEYALQADTQSNID